MKSYNLTPEQHEQTCIALIWAARKHAKALFLARAQDDSVSCLRIAHNLVAAIHALTALNQKSPDSLEAYDYAIRILDKAQP